MRKVPVVFLSAVLLSGSLISQSSESAGEDAALKAQVQRQEEEIRALQAALAEQRKMIESLQRGEHPAVEAAVPPPAAPATPNSPATEALAPEPAPAGVSSSKPTTLEARQATVALKQEEREQPYVKEPKQWFNKYSLRGYVQVRENNLINTNGKYKCDQCDKSIGPGNTFFFRRVRLVLSGQVSDHVSVYIQPDFASASGTSLNYAQIRDAYFDVTIDPEKKNRLRFGQSKIPYGFEEMQSSSNRLDFDRSDALNSAFPNERDLGVFYYWAPARIRERLNELVSKGLKGSGDFGAFGAGFFNGQLVNTLEANNDFHYVARYTYPFKLPNGQFIETSVQGYTGKYKLPSVGAKTLAKPDLNYDDQRIAISLIIYPQPLGLQVEYNWGNGPQYNPRTNFIDQKGLNGGYALLNYRWPVTHSIVLHPFARFQYYKGGKKQELDARSYLVREGDIGLETQFGKYIEPTLQYQIGNRITQDSSNLYNAQKGSLLRLQLQFNY